MKDDLRNVDTLVTVSGGMECAAALLWSLKKGLKPVGVHLFNKNKDFAEADLFFAQKQCDLLGVRLIVDEVDLPRSKPITAVFQWQTACSTLVVANPHIDWKYCVWGSNSEDSWRQRQGLKYASMMQACEYAGSLDRHGVTMEALTRIPVNLFPFEFLTKSEIASILLRENKEITNLIWSCAAYSKIAKVGEKIVDYIPCGKCSKCIERKSAFTTARNAQFRIQEGKDYESSYKD